MALAMNFDAFRAISSASMARIERLERTPEGRAELAAEYRREAAALRARSGVEIWRDAGGEVNSYVAPPVELERRARERADKLEKQAAELDAIEGIYDRWAALLKGTEG